MCTFVCGRRLALPLALPLVLVLLAAAPAGAQEKLTLRDVYIELRARNPQLAARKALAEAAVLREPIARTPADPAVQLGVMNLSLPGLNADMPSSMAPSAQLMQMLPFPGKLSLAGGIAAKSTAVAQAQADERWWQLRAQAAMSFYELYSLDRQLQVMNETLQLLEDFRKVALAMYGAGTGRQSDVLRAHVERSKMKANVIRMQAMRMAAAARLNGILNRPAETVIPAVAVRAMPAAVPARDTLRTWAESDRPMLAQGRALVEQTQLQRSLANRELWPDFTIAIGYGQRSTDMGVERMGSAMIGFSVPIFAARRQLRMRDEAGAMARMAQAELSDMRAQVDTRIGELLAELERTTSLIAMYRTDILPQAEANVQSSFSAYRVGSVDFMTLVDAQMTVNRYRQELFALAAEHGSAIAELEMNIGRELPVTQPLALEDL